MHYIYLKVILKAVSQNLDFIFIDETACYLGNDNYRDWVAENEEIIKGSEIGLKSRISIIMVINLKRIMHYKIIENNVIEYLFGFLKNEYYKYIFKNKEEQITKIKEIFVSNELKENMQNFFVQDLQKYAKFYEDSGFDLGNIILNDLSSIDEDEEENNKSLELSKSYN